jgi:hypothetical protein
MVPAWKVSYKPASGLSEKSCLSLEGPSLEGPKFSFETTVKHEKMGDGRFPVPVRATSLDFDF